MQFLRELKKLFVGPSFAVLVGRSLCLCFAVLACTTPLRADVTGSILGYVRDSSGGVLPNATLTATQASTGYTRTTTSDGSGQYTFLALPPGIYRLTASGAGFENGVVENINLNVNDALKFDFVLKVGNVSQTVSVDASAVQVDTTTTSMGTTITSSQILAMPSTAGRTSICSHFSPVLLLRIRLAPITIARPPPASTARRGMSPLMASLSGPTPSW